MDVNLDGLSKEKKEAIIGAAMEVFALNEYKRASTDLIASKAGISKGLLFYYFKNKKTLYMYLMDAMIEEVRPLILDTHFHEIEDFFELLEYASMKKVKILQRYPYLMEFCVRAYFSQKEDVSHTVENLMQGQIDAMVGTYFKNIKMNKFREDVNPDEILHMLVWLTDGYMHEQQRSGKSVDAEKLVCEFRKWSAMLKKISYREEYQDECN